MSFNERLKALEKAQKELTHKPNEVATSHSRLSKYEYLDLWCRVSDLKFKIGQNLNKKNSDFMFSITKDIESIVRDLNKWGIK